MEMEQLKTAVKNITLSEEKKEQMLYHYVSNLNKQEVRTMQPTNKFDKKQKRIALALACCLCVTATMAIAGGKTGFFQDIKRIDGAIIGMEYQMASDEIQVATQYQDGHIVVEATFLKPAQAPYRELETLAVAQYKVMNQNGDVVEQGLMTEYEPIVDGSTMLQLSAETLVPGSYQLEIHAFSGAKKADQPLRMEGIWTSTVEVR